MIISNESDGCAHCRLSGELGQSSYGTLTVELGMRDPAVLPLLGSSSKETKVDDLEMQRRRLVALVLLLLAASHAGHRWPAITFMQKLPTTPPIML